MVGLELVARPSEETLVGGDHPGDDDVVDHLGIGLHADGHPILGCDTGLLISDIANQELCLTSGELEREVSLSTSRGTLLGTYDEDGGHG